MSKDGCIFCKMAAGLVPAAKIYEDETVLAFLDIGPVSDGHALVIPKEHFEKLHDCPPQILCEAWSRLGKIASAVVAGVNAEGYNVICNTGRAAGQLVEHVHFHIVPRKTGDGVFNRWPSYKYKPGMIEKIADEIRKNL